MIGAKVDVKPLSWNKSYQGRKFKTPAYKSFEKELLLSLPGGKISNPPYRIEFEFGVSSKLCDWDNFIKNTQDILQKKYDFNDRDIMEGYVKKVLVGKGDEYIKFNLRSLTSDQQQ